MRVQVKLFPGWSDCSAENPDGPPTYIRLASVVSGAFQISHAEYSDGEVPDSTPEQLQKLAESIAAKSHSATVLARDSGICEFGTFGSAVVRDLEAERLQVWVLSNGKDFITASHVCCGNADPVEVDEANQMAKMLRLQNESRRPWWKVW